MTAITCFLMAIQVLRDARSE